MAKNVQDHTNNEKPQWWIRYISGKYLSIFLAGTTILFFGIKGLYYQHLNCTIGECFWLTLNDVIHHTDYIGYIVGILGIYVGCYVAKKVEESNEIKNKELDKKIRELSSIENQISNSVDELRGTTLNIEATNAEIKESTKALEDKTERLKEETKNAIDASRRIIVDVFEIFKSIETTLEAVSARTIDKFYYMNGPASFGKLHTYNKRILRVFKKKEDNNDIGAAEIITCNNIAVKIASLLIGISKQAVDFKMIVSPPDKVSEFADEYFENENKRSEKFEGLLDYKITSSVNFSQINYDDEINNDNVKVKITLSDENNKEDIQTTVKEKFLKFNNTVIDMCKKNRENKSLDSIKFCQEDPQYQIYLIDCNTDKYSLLIFYHDEDKIENGQAVKIRRLVGFSSDNRHIYKGLEDMYLDKFKNAN
ncbi:hypothetical protein EWM62_14145 [Mucilaginibacter terrigena]|uniref:Uncharacterized protein n=1 Tax=Mucilaginibacter terrigena TaxID=2492395 RepID=A0A4Q5LJ99_9SPHI|nr:hypothetical protein [Mucilaginibacter terrigena]RYU89458.1 hypothetical protein EWM62_14145 [Mucilaginibacter terrigena]